MTLLGQPVPPLPEPPHPLGAPPGVTVDFEAFRAWNNGVLDPTRRWVDTRPEIDPQVIVAHTNAASGEASTDSKERWGNTAETNTKAHYNINNPTPKKHVPTNRRAIANSTGASVEEQFGVRDSSYWSIAIETADQGTRNAPTGPDGGPALDFVSEHHAELVARVIAYEAIAHDIPIEVPVVFNKTMRGVVTHTAPFPYPYFTTVRGKTCPTWPKKERVLRGDILPRANELAFWWRLQLQPQEEPVASDTLLASISAQLAELNDLLVNRVDGIALPPDSRKSDPWLVLDGGSVRAACTWDVGDAASGVPALFPGVPFRQVTDPVQWDNLKRSAGLA